MSKKPKTPKKTKKEALQAPSSAITVEDLIQLCKEPLYVLGRNMGSMKVPKAIAKLPAITGDHESVFKFHHEFMTIPHDEQVKLLEFITELQNFTTAYSLTTMFPKAGSTIPIEIKDGKATSSHAVDLQTFMVLLDLITLWFNTPGCIPVFKGTVVYTLDRVKAEKSFKADDNVEQIYSTICSILKPIIHPLEKLGYVQLLSEKKMEILGAILQETIHAEIERNGGDSLVLFAQAVTNSFQVCQMGESFASNVVSNITSMLESTPAGAKLH